MAALSYYSKRADSSKWKDTSGTGTRSGKSSVESGKLEWGKIFLGKKTVRLTVDNISPEGWKLCVGGPENGATFSVKEKHAELSFLMETGEAAACGGGRKKRTGILEMDVENVEILIDSSIMEIFINGGAMVFTTRIYLKENERELWASKAGKQTLRVL